MKRRRLRVVLALLCLCTLSSFPIASGIRPARAAFNPTYDQSSPFGVVGNLAINVRRDEQPRMIDLMREAGVQWHREDFSWERLQPKRDGPYLWQGDGSDFLNFDETVNRVSQGGMRILGLLGYNPAWFKGKNPQLDAWIGDWQSYVYSVVTRYGRERGQIKYWEIWNEPNLAFYGYENGLYTIQDYARLLSVTYPVVKAADPDAVVVLGGLANVWSEAPPHFYDAWDYLEVLGKAGAWSSFDVLNLHAYRPGAPEGRFLRRDRMIDFDDEMAAIDDLQQKFGAKPIWITEISWGSDTGPFGVSEQDQAYYLVRFYALALRAPKIEKLFWYNFRNNMAAQQPYDKVIVDARNPDWNMGLLRRTYPLRTDADQLRKPAFVAFRTMAGMLGGLMMTESIANGDRGDVPQLYWYRYGAAENGVQLLWQLGPYPTTVTAACTCTEVRVRGWDGSLKRIINTDTGVMKLSIPGNGEPVYLEYRADRKSGSMTFAETGHSLGGVFLDYWRRNGGLAQFGFPISEELTEPDPNSGRARTVQYFERNRFEYFPENEGTPYVVQLGRLGETQLLNQGIRWQAQPLNPQTPSGCRRFPQTRRLLCSPFRAYWEQRGGLSMYGAPLTDAYYENGRLVQYFERNRFEYHPEYASTPYEVLLGLLGNELFTSREGSSQ